MLRPVEALVRRIHTTDQSQNNTNFVDVHAPTHYEKYAFSEKFLTDSESRLLMEKHKKSNLRSQKSFCSWNIMNFWISRIQPTPWWISYNTSTRGLQDFGYYSINAFSQHKINVPRMVQYMYLWFLYSNVWESIKDQRCSIHKQQLTLLTSRDDIIEEDVAPFGLWPLWENMTSNQIKISVSNYPQVTNCGGTRRILVLIVTKNYLSEMM